jgi:hypothetical protein
MNRYELKPGLKQTFKVQRWGKLLHIEVGAIPDMSFSELSQMYDRTGLVFMNSTRTLNRRDKYKFARTMFLQSLSPKKRQNLRSRVYFGKARISRYAKRVDRIKAMYNDVTSKI